MIKKIILILIAIPGILAIKHTPNHTMTPSIAPSMTSSINITTPPITNTTTVSPTLLMKSDASNTTSTNVLLGLGVAMLLI